MRFDLIDLRLFVNIHHAGTITGGAQASHMTLASASERIRGLEDDIGSPLLTRSRSGVTPTPAGLTLLHHARLVLLQIDRLQGELVEAGTGPRGQVRVLCNTSALARDLPALLGDFLASHPGIDLDLDERPSSDIADALRAGRGDLGIASDSADLQGLESFAFRPDPLVVVVARSHPFAADRSVSLADVVDHEFTGLAAGSALQEHLEHHARRLGRHLRYRVRLPDFESVCRMVGRGIGVAVVPSAVASRFVRSARIRLLPLTDAFAARHLLLCTLRAEALSPQALLVLRHLQDASDPRAV
jgi:DNA-binding transcriptional LysR family regulator